MKSIIFTTFSSASSELRRRSSFQQANFSLPEKGGQADTSGIEFARRRFAIALSLDFLKEI